MGVSYMDLKQSILKYFKDDQKYEVKTDFKDYGVRVDLYCYKGPKDKKKEETMIDLTVSDEINVEDFFGRGKEIGTPLMFYRFYFSRAKVYLGVPTDTIKKRGIFIRKCEERGIGLIEVNDEKNVTIVVDAKPYIEMLAEKIRKSLKPKTEKNETAGRDSVYKIINDYFQDHTYIVYDYGKPEFQLRGVKGRGLISFKLIDKLREVKNIDYYIRLKEFAEGFRDEPQGGYPGNDYDIALHWVEELWKKYGMKYPKIQRELEDILLRKPEYREHFVHQFQVFLLGSYIIDKMYGDKKGEKVINSFKTKYNCKIEIAWLFAATFHDFNYSIQQYNTWIVDFLSEALRLSNKIAKNKISGLYLDTTIVREKMLEKLKDIVKNLRGREEVTDFDEKIEEFFYEKAVLDRNHGVLSALSLLKLYDENRNPKITKEGIIQSAIAIAIHDEDIWEALCGCKGYRRGTCDTCTREIWPEKESRIPKEKCESWEKAIMDSRPPILKEISFENFPLQFLLIFCDIAQDEGRVVSYLGEKGEEKDDRSQLDNVNFTDGKMTVTLLSRAYELTEKEKKGEKNTTPRQLKVEELQRVQKFLNDKRFDIHLYAIEEDGQLGSLWQFMMDGKGH